ncbi:MAG: FHA domain-containing protein [Chloroflexi bacterium]|nr:FHA domain-containing protein [Chloroflexota bacterium]
MGETYFDMLGLSLDANDSQIGQAYRKRKAELQRNPERLRQVEEAYRILANPINRRNYLLALRSGDSDQSASVNPRTDSAANLPPPPTAHAAHGRNGGGLPDAGAARRVEAGPVARGRPTRQPTELYESTRGPEPAAPAAAPEQGRGRRARQPTELNDNNPGDMPAEPSQADRMDVTVERSRIPDEATRIARVRTIPETPVPRVQVVYQGRTEVFELQLGVNWVGRPSKSMPAPTVPLPDPERYISRQHARIFVEGSTCFITDTSDNGTQLNGKWLPKGQPHRLKDGDVITVEGRELTIRLP